MTKFRFSTALFCVLYIAAACCVGLLHDHHNANSQEHCAACAWAVKAVTDVSAPVVLAVTEVVTPAPMMPASVIIVAPLFSNTASRAPPLASA